MNDVEWQSSLLGKFIALPEETQEAVCWVTQNLDFLERLTQGDSFTAAELDLYTRQALQEKDYLLLAITKYKQYKDQLTISHSKT